jgi:aminopeptidase N
LLKVYYDAVGIPTTDEYFEGVVNISLKIVSPTSTIKLHAHETLKIMYPIQLVNMGTNQMTSIDETMSMYDQYDIFKIMLPSLFAVGDYKLRIMFRGDFKMSNGLVGFYKTSYQEDNTQKTILATNFEPTDARKAL